MDNAMDIMQATMDFLAENPDCRSDEVFWNAVLVGIVGKMEAES